MARSDHGRHPRTRGEDTEEAQAGILLPFAHICDSPLPTYFYLFPLPYLIYLFIYLFIYIIN